MLSTLGDFINVINSDNWSNIKLGPLSSTLSSTLLEHFSTINSTLSVSKSTGFSHHDLVFGMYISGSMQKEPEIVNCRNTKHYTPEIFRKALSEVFLEHILTAKDPTTMFELWLDKFTDILDQIATLFQPGVGVELTPRGFPRHRPKCELTKMKLSDF